VNSIQHIRLVAIHKRAKGQVVYRSSWPPNVGNYLRFVLMKENIDTMSAVNLLCKVMRLKDNNSIYFAGTKDKRGITSQWCTMYRRKPSVICRINKYQLPPTIRVGNFEFGNFYGFLRIIMYSNKLCIFYVICILLSCFNYHHNTLNSCGRC
jgi:hypothetical protein